MGKSSESVVSHINLTMWDRMDAMKELVKENLEKAQHVQKKWYDQNARHRELKVGLEQRARHKTAFSTPFRYIQFKMMLFGLQELQADGPRHQGYGCLPSIAAPGQTTFILWAGLTAKLIGGEIPRATREGEGKYLGHLESLRRNRYNFQTIHAISFVTAPPTSQVNTHHIVI
ncbi:hypothetical protein EMCRGX_G012279 [Ephydatia muelleri]